MATPQSSLMSDGFSIGGATPRDNFPSSSYGAYPSSGRPDALVETPGPHSDGAGPHESDTKPKVPRKKTNPADIKRRVDPLAATVSDGFESFLCNFPNPHDDRPADPMVREMTENYKPQYYITMLQSMRRLGMTVLYIDFNHLEYFSPPTARAIVSEYYRLTPAVNKTVEKVAKEHGPRLRKKGRDTYPSTPGLDPSTPGFSGMTPRASGMDDDDEEELNSKETEATFSVAFFNLKVVSRLRNLRSTQIGNLLSISGTVTRTSEVRPELSLATFVCEVCRSVVFNVEQAFRYTEPSQCPNDMCNNRFAWRLDMAQSTFTDWQKVRIQENSSEIPTGSMPRTMDVIMRGAMVDQAQAGEKCIFTGALIVVPDVSQLSTPGQRPYAMRDSKRTDGDGGGDGVTGLKALGVRELTYRMAFLACTVSPQIVGADMQLIDETIKTLTTNTAENGPGSRKETENLHLTDIEVQEIRSMVHADNIYQKLITSFAPMVFGHETVKKGLLLQLVSGVHKSTPEGMELRGDINICIVGDPSTSKSQFLKYVCSFAPRAVYTSGKASSAAGLTAAVVKDEETGEFTIEAGALMLADNGICAIDEFDKMDISDQVAIHEAMEQQTISIAKAGIHATLNAKTSVLAAANPVGGRYNRKASLRANINMSAPIMSRFDLFFVILDDCSEQTDCNLARHIVGIHQLRDEAVQPLYSTEQLQRYVRFARTYKPTFTDEARTHLVKRYQELRSDDAQGGIGRNSYRITVRQLESLIRLSEAVAKINCVDDVIPLFVDEAYDLLRTSIISIEHDDLEFDEGEETDEALLAAARRAAGESEDTEMHDDTTAAMAQSQQKIKVTYEKYLEIVRLFVKMINESESEEGEGVREDNLVQEYIRVQESQMQTEDDLKRETLTAYGVLKLMVKNNVIMAIRGEGFAENTAGGTEGLGNNQRLVYVLHPNCAPEDLV